MEMEEEDPVVKELDVFVSSQLAKHLYLLQYPLRPKKRPYQTQDSQVHARIKPKVFFLFLSFFFFLLFFFKKKLNYFSIKLNYE